jgi:predicted peptidase
MSDSTIDLFEPRAVHLAGEEFGYRLLTPERAAAGDRFPLVLFLHGIGERGTDNRAQLKHLP